MRYKGSPEEKAKAAQENGFDGDDDCIAFKGTRPYISGCYEDLDHRTDYPQPSFPQAIIDNISLAATAGTPAWIPGEVFDEQIRMLAKRFYPIPSFSK